MKQKCWNSTFILFQECSCMNVNIVEKLSLIKLVSMEVSQERDQPNFRFSFSCHACYKILLLRHLKKLQISFQSSFKFTATLKGRYGDFPYTLIPYTYTTSPIINFPYQSGIFITIEEPTLAHHSHPKQSLHLCIPEL